MVSPIDPTDGMNLRNRDATIILSRMDSPRAFSPRSTPVLGRSVEEIQNWIVNRLAKELRMDVEKLKGDQSILSLGIDAVQAVSVMSELEDWGGFRFSGNPLEDDVTIRELSEHVAVLTGNQP